MNDLITTEWYTEFVEECKAIVTETIHNSRWDLLNGYHALGERISTDENFQAYVKGNGGWLKTLSEAIKVGERTIYYSIQFYAKYPDMSLLPEGKAISWNKVIKLLPDAPQEKSKPISRADLIQMLKEIKVLLEHEWQDTKLELVGAANLNLNKDDLGEDIKLLEARRDYIRYLQDQFNKITNGAVL